jgi:hypothetical protein
MACNGGAKKIAVNGVYLISVLRLEHFDLISDALPFGRLLHGGPALHSLVNRNRSVGNRYREWS